MGVITLTMPFLAAVLWSMGSAGDDDYRNAQVKASWESVVMMRSRRIFAKGCASLRMVWMVCS